MLSVGHVPIDWLCAIIVHVLVFKKGVAGKLGNYRPVSMTCVPSKILERITVFHRKTTNTCVLIIYYIPVSTAFISRGPLPLIFLNV